MPKAAWVLDLAAYDPSLRVMVGLLLLAVIVERALLTRRRPEASLVLVWILTVAFVCGRAAAALTAELPWNLEVVELMNLRMFELAHALVLPVFAVAFVVADRAVGALASAVRARRASRP